MDEFGQVRMTSSGNKPVLQNIYMNPGELLKRMAENAKKRRFRSWVWEYFIPTDRKTAKCTICDKVIVHGHPTSHLINHLTKGDFSFLLYTFIYMDLVSGKIKAF